VVTVTAAGFAQPFALADQAWRVAGARLERSRPCDSTECRKHPHPWPSHPGEPLGALEPFRCGWGMGGPEIKVAMPRESL